MTLTLSAAQSPVEISDAGDLLVSAGFVVAVLVLAIFVGAVWLLLKLLAETWRLLVLVAAVVFVTCWLPVQCDTDAIFFRPYDAQAQPLTRTHRRMHRQDLRGNARGRKPDENW